MMAGVVAINITLHVIRNQTDVGASDEYRVAYRQINTLLFVAVVVYWQRSLIARDVWWALIDPEDFHQHTMADVKGGVGIRASKRGSLSLRRVDGLIGNVSTGIDQLGAPRLAIREGSGPDEGGDDDGRRHDVPPQARGHGGEVDAQDLARSNRSRRSSKKPRNCSTSPQLPRRLTRRQHRAARRARPRAAEPAIPGRLSTAAAALFD